MWTARTFVDCFNPDNRYSVTTHAANTGVPTQFIFGSEECAGPQELPVCGAARRSLESANYPHVHVTVIDGADHGYVNRETHLMEAILAFLESL